MSAYCERCKGVKINEFHRCPPRWLVRHADDDTPFEDMILRARYARDASAAAEAFARGWLAGEYDECVVSVDVLNYPEMTEITRVDVEQRIEIQCYGIAQSTTPFRAFEEESEAGELEEAHP